MEKKLLLFDVDGTLISYDGILPKSTVEGIRQARKKGHYVFVVTGRSKGHMSPRVVDIGFDGMIGGNGSYIEAFDTIIQDITFSDDEVKMFVDYLERKELSFYMESDHCVYGSIEFDTRAIPAFEAYGCKKPVNVRKLYPDMEFPASLYQSHISKINYILHSYQDYIDFKNTFPKYKCMTWGGQGENAIFGDVTLYTDKSKAIKILAKHLHIEKENIISFGDADVDIAMFEASGISIAVNSGKEAAKQAASYITDSVVDDGIYNALQHFNLI